MVCTPWAAVLGSRTRVDPYNRSITKPLTGEPDAGDPPVRFGGRGKVQSLVPTPIDPELDAAVFTVLTVGQVDGLSALFRCPNRLTFSNLTGSRKQAK